MRGVEIKKENVFVNVLLFYKSSEVKSDHKLSKNGLRLSSFRSCNIDDFTLMTK